MLALLIAGCEARVLVPNEADRLREQLLERTNERDAAQARVAELEAQAMRLSAESRGSVDPEAAEATPALAGIAVSGLSTARITEQGAATLALVIEPTDGLGRFMQVTGTLRISGAVLIPGAEPQPIAPRTVGPKELRGLYRSGFLGTHYTVELPVRWTGEGVARGVAVSVEFVEAWTGRTYPATATVTAVPPAPPTPPIAPAPPATSPSAR